MIKLRLVVLLAAIVPSVIGASSALGDDSQTMPLAGGYSKAPITEPDVVLATQRAVQAQRRRQSATIVLVVIESAEKQVVAGMNYRLNFKVKSGNEIQRIQAVVYRDLQDKYSLSSWEKITP